MAIHYQCPLCQQTLLAEPTRWLCPQGHSFDRARQGYTHLLPVQHKRSRQPGDDAQMVAARGRFLSTGYYRAFADKLAQMLITHCRQAGLAQVNILDAGCGEGYYTVTLAQALREAAIDAHICAVDISKFALRAAARRSSAIDWFVASSAAPPPQPAQIDIVISLFAPLFGEAFAGILKPQGVVLAAGAGAQHLMSLRQLLYREVKTDCFDPASALAPQFRCIEQQQLCCDIALPDTQTIADLLAMTPHYWRATAAQKQALLAQNQLDTQLDIWLSLFARAANPANKDATAHVASTD